MSARVYCFGSAKGGSGKTVITATVASFLTTVGKKCLIIDCDAATHGMTLLYLVEVSAHSNENRMGLFDFIADKESEQIVEESIISIEHGVDFLPATYRFSSIVDFDERANLRLPNLERIVRTLRPKYDVILLDAQAGSDVHAREAMSSRVSDEVIVVSEYDPMSSAGVDKLRHMLGDDLSYARTWILLNKLLPEFVSKFEEFLSVLSYLPPLPWNADVVRAYAKRKLALDLQEGNEFTLAILRMIGVLFGEELEGEITEWSKKQAYALKAPLEEQYSVAEAELVAALESRRKFNFRRLFIRMSVFYVVVIFMCGLLYLLVDFVTVDSVNTAKDPSAISITLAITMMVLGSIFAMGYSIWKWVSGRRTAESLRYERVITALEERLAKLETLRSASYEEYVRRRNR